MDYRLTKPPPTSGNRVEQKSVSDKEKIWNTPIF